jgi:glycosyltransferase involved in cell wall biosynthesis
VKVLHVIHSDAFAGVERHVAQLAAAQARRGDQVVVIGGDQERMAVESSAQVVLRPAATAWETLRAVRTAARGRPDVVHAHMTVGEAASIVALLGTRIPVVATRHFAQVRGRNGVVRALTGLLARRLAAQIAISDYVAHRVEGECTVVHPGVPVQPDALPARERSRTVLVVQRLEQEKATDDALRIFARSGLAALGWRLEVAGSGSQLGVLQLLASDLGLADHVTFLGHRTDVPELMRRSGILIAPCPVEGLGLTVVEAMAAGLPIVAAAAGGHLETLTGIPGTVLYDPATGLDEAAAGLAALAADEPARDESASAFQRAQRESFTLERQAEATEAVYRSVL